MPRPHLTRTILLHVLTLMLIFQAAVCPGQRPVQIQKEPYLIFPDNHTEMQLLWQLSGDAECTLAWGLDTSYDLGSTQTSEYGGDHQHTFTISNLTPGATYYYRVTAPDGTHTGSFRAAPDPFAYELKFLAYGDTRTYPQTHDGVAEAMVATFTADPAWQTFTLHAGDLVSDGNREDDWTDEFFDSSLTHIRQMMASIPLLACIGNHEGSGQLFLKYFPYPFVGGRYWSFDYGSIHVVIVDQYTSYTPGSAQLNWIQDDLASTHKPWRFMLFHEPGWSAGGHSNEVPVQEYLQPLCEQYGVSICFAGHNHYYARAVVNGVHHVTTGGGGAPLYAPNSSYPNIVAAAQEYHFCKIQITPGLLSFEAVTPEGEVLDSFLLEYVSPVPEPLPTAGMALGLAVPNPFNPLTRIPFTLDEPQRIRIAVFDLQGRLVAPLADAFYPGGRHLVRWNGRDGAGRSVASGSYILQLQGQQQSLVQKLILAR